MKHAISEAERAKYTRIWSLESYHERSPGENKVPLFERMLKPQSGDAILDIGAGDGAASRALKDRGYSVAAFDLTAISWPHDDIPLHVGTVWRDLCQLRSPGFGFGFCCDVMEHLPEQMVALSVHQMLSVCNQVFLAVSFLPDGFGDCIGDTLHLTVHSYTWWRDTLRELGTLVSSRDLIGEGVFHVAR